MSRLSVSKCTKCYFIKPLSANAAHQLIKFTFSAKGNTTRLCILRGFLLILKQGINFFPTAGYRVDSAAPTVQADSTMDTQLRAPIRRRDPLSWNPPGWRQGAGSVFRTRPARQMTDAGWTDVALHEILSPSPHFSCSCSSVQQDVRLKLCMCVSEWMLLALDGLLFIISFEKKVSF